MMTLDHIKALVGCIRHKDWDFRVEDKNGTPFLQVQFDAPCSKTGVVERQYCRKWMLSYHMTETEVVRTAYKACIAAAEYEVHLWEMRYLMANEHIGLSERKSIPAVGHGTETPNLVCASSNLAGDTSTAMLRIMPR